MDAASLPSLLSEFGNLSIFAVKRATQRVESIEQCPLSNLVEKVLPDALDPNDKPAGG